MKNLKSKTLKELRLQHPNIKATSVKIFLEKLEALKQIEVVAEQLEIPTENVLAVIDEISDAIVNEEDETLEDSLTWYTIIKYLTKVSTTNEKILITCPTSIEADLMFSRLKADFFPLMNEQEISIMASSTRRDMHLNGSCYVRLVCNTNAAHLKRIFRYTTFKDLV